MLRFLCALIMICFLLSGTHAYAEEPSQDVSNKETTVDAQHKTEGSQPTSASDMATEPAVSNETGGDNTHVSSGTTDTSSSAMTPVKKPAETRKPSKTHSTATATPSREDALKEWKFLKEIGNDKRDEMAETTLFQLIEFLRLNGDQDFSDEAQMLKSELHVRMADYKSAVVDILELIYEYPNSRLALSAKSTLADLLQKRMDKKLKPVLYEISKGSDLKGIAERKAELLKKLSEQAGDELFEPIVIEFDNFFCRYPSFEGIDELDLSFGDLQIKKKKYLTALTYYRKVLALYPESSLRPRALRSIGDLYMNNLKDMSEAVNAYQEVINKYAQSDEAGYSYEQTAKLEEQLKHYNLATELNEKIIALYPKTDLALRAFNNEARLYLDQMDRPNEAIAVYGRLADMFKGSSDAAEALKTAAKTAEKQKKYEQAVSLYMRFVNECSTSKDAPELYYQAGQVTEENLKKIDDAIELYRQVAEKYPESKYAGKANGRIKSLMKK